MLCEWCFLDPLTPPYMGRNKDIAFFKDPLNSPYMGRNKDIAFFKDPHDS